MCGWFEPMKNNLQKSESAELHRLEKNKKRAGISVVETMVALVLLAFFITGSTKILFAQRKLADKSREHYSAINIAKNRIELVRIYQNSQTDTFIEEIDFFIENNIVVDATGAPDVNGNFRRSTVPSVISSNLVEIAVTIELRDRKTLSFDGEQETLTSYFTEYLTAASSVGSGVGGNSN